MISTEYWLKSIIADKTCQASKGGGSKRIMGYFGERTEVWRGFRCSKVTVYWAVSESLVSVEVPWRKLPAYWRAFSLMVDAGRGCLRSGIIRELWSVTRGVITDWTMNWLSENNLHPPLFCLFSTVYAWFGKTICVCVTDPGILLIHLCHVVQLTVLSNCPDLYRE